MAIQDVKELLMKYASVLPVFDRRLDRVEVLQMNHEEAFRSIMSNGKKENRMLSIQFIVDGHIGPYMSLTDNNRTSITRYKFRDYYLHMSNLSCHNHLVYNVFSFILLFCCFVFANIQQKNETTKYLVISFTKTKLLTV
jgi:hypothetical protein